MKGMSVMVFGTQRRRPCGRFPAGPSMWFCLAFLVCLAASAYAAPPDLQTPAPVVYLADNLDEQDKLGWCIDTVGRGFGERLHAHSCKPRGGDVQFDYDRGARRIVSATYKGKCATLLAPAAAGATFGLLDCADNSAAQVFDYDAEAMEFRPGADRTLCLVVGAASRTAGPFMSRGLGLAPCAATDAARKQWRINAGPF